MTKILRAEEARHNTQMLLINDREAVYHILLKWAEEKIPLSTAGYIYTSAQLEKINNPDAMKQFEKHMIDLGYEVDIDYDLNSWSYGQIYVRW